MPSLFYLAYAVQTEDFQCVLYAFSRNIESTCIDVGRVII